MYTAVTAINHGGAGGPILINAGETLPDDTFTQAEFAALLNVGAITGDESGYSETVGGVEEAEEETGGDTGDTSTGDDTDETPPAS